MNIPFYPNTKDDTHCMQAALKMVLSGFFPTEEYSFKELDRITGHIDGKWTYPYKMYNWLADKGLQVRHIELFDVNKFAKEGEKFLKELWNPEVYKIQSKYSDFRQAQEDARQALESGKVSFEYDAGTISKIQELFMGGYTVLVRVNPFTLRNVNGDGSHVIVVTNVEKYTITLHDPGLPPQESLQVSLNRMKKAMYNNDTLIIAIK
jgi:hypothetical protein